MIKKTDITWCPGCGNYAIRDVLEKVLHELPIPRKDIAFTSGIGQAAKMPQYLEVNYFNGLHGRSLPLAVGIKLARPDLTVVSYSGDGCLYGEGGNHFIHAIRRRLDLTIITSDNQIYGLTKGQSSPTTDFGVKNALDPRGNENIPLNPLSLAINMGAPFVARGYAGDKDHLGGIIREAILFKGTAVVDILQPCVSFNNINTYQWYHKRVFKVDNTPADRYEAMKLAEQWGDKIPIGIIYRDDKAECRELAKIFREPLTEADIREHLAMKCVMMR
ncbi:MAG: thiamine pyrophosphate-dependent enzyme [Syntrophales bacterium]|jgi:2-oxoglutarate ferredoxin oxidoreductase subunit beta|nr:thiamine pyrophosphate-dependent enzyme [Syntrophales bacterium]MCK9392689.1 thiamine pyrophosphate-dependent enzyme [Syntrophales bacterium]